MCGPTLSLPLFLSLSSLISMPFQYTRLSINKCLQIKRNGKCCNAANWNSFFLCTYVYLSSYANIYLFLLTIQKNEHKIFLKVFEFFYFSPTRFAVVKNVSQVLKYLTIQWIFQHFMTVNPSCVSFLISVDHILRFTDKQLFSFTLSPPN